MEIQNTTFTLRYSLQFNYKNSLHNIFAGEQYQDIKRHKLIHLTMLTIIQQDSIMENIYFVIFVKKFIQGTKRVTMCPQEALRKISTRWVILKGVFEEILRKSH